MTRPILLSVVVMSLATFPAWGQHAKEFPADKCAYTLPSEGWEWMDPTLVKKSKLTALAKNQDGIAFSLEICAIDSNERPVAKSYYPSFEAGYLKSSNSEKLSGGTTDFHGLPAYQFNSKMAIGAVSSYVLVVCANDRSYHLTVIDASGGAYTTRDVKKVFDGFRFTSPPQPVFKDEMDQARNRGEKVGLAAMTLLGLIVVAFFGYRILRPRKKD